MLKAGKTPLVLVACGSFSPITFLHLRSESSVWFGLTEPLGWRGGCECARHRGGPSKAIRPMLTDHCWWGCSV